MSTREELLVQMQQHPDIVLLMKEVRTILDGETKKRAEFRNLIHENVTAEFINGEIVYHSPAKRRHWRVLAKLLSRLNQYVEDNQLGEVGSEKVMIELTRNDYEPDIVFFNKEKSSKFTDDQMLFPAPDFIVEIVSPSTEKYDRNEKFIDYAAHGVAEYLIIDPELQTVEHFLNENGMFRLFQKLHKGQLESTVIKGFAVDLKSIFS
jgi:Uma2 family endonuclease